MLAGHAGFAVGVAPRRLGQVAGRMIKAAIGCDNMIGPS